MRLKAAELSALCGGSLIYGSGENIADHICIDSRKADRGSLFVPIIGERVDAHAFLKDVAAGGASCILSSRHGSEEELSRDEELYGELQKRGESVSVISVKDTVGALQALAAGYRRKHISSVPVVGITGSVGKTTTREMTACALSCEKRVFATKGNLNSQVGVPMMVTEIGDEDMAVLELGVSMSGEMDRIAAAAAPDAAIITNIGISHIEYLGSRENILKEKLRIVTGAGKPVSVFINADNDILSGLSMEGLKDLSIDPSSVSHIYRCGFSEGCDVRAERLELHEGCPSFLLSFYDRDGDGRLMKEPAMSLEVKLSAPGEHMASDAILALAVCRYFGIDVKKAAESLASFRSLKGRGEKLEVRGITVINDSYNAAPDSMKAALSVLFSMDQAKRRIAVLADMRELGPESRKLHREIGGFIAENAGKIDKVLLYGELSRDIEEGLLDALSDKDAGTPETLHFDSLTKLREYIRTEERKGDAILFKGSNSMGLSSLVTELYEDKKG